MCIRDSFVGGPHTRITNPRWRTAAIVEKLKNCYNSATVRAILTKFGTVKHINLLDRPTVKNLKFRKSKMAAAAILKKSKIAISQPRFERFRRNLAWWCILTLLTVRTVKSLKFQKSKIAAVRHLGFVMRVWGPPTMGICWSLSLCKIWLESMQ